MNLPNVKLTMFFEYGDIGWSESHFLPGVTDLDNPNLYDLGAELAKARVKCLDGLNGTLVDVRFSVDNINRDTDHLPTSQLPVKSGVGYYQPSPVSAANSNGLWTWQSPQLSWVALLETAVAGVFGDEYIAGMPASTTQLGPSPTQNGGQAVAAALSAYFDVLCNGDYGMAYRGWPVGPQIAGNSVPVTAPPTWTSRNATTPNTLTFVVANWAMFEQPAEGSFVRLAGATFNSPVKRARCNGSFKVISSSPTGCVVNADRITVNPNFQLPGYLQVNTPAVAPYVRYVLRNITHHKRGRPTSVPRGRRS